MLAARWGDVPPPFAAAFATLLLLATWASVQHWYRQIDHFDLLVHVLTPGSLAAAAYFMLARRRLLPSVRSRTDGLKPSSAILWVLLVGVTAAVVWEFYEYVVERLAPSTMVVGYGDTIADLLAGLLGSLVAGGLVWRWSRRHGATSTRAHPYATHEPADCLHAEMEGKNSPQHNGSDPFEVSHHKEATQCHA